MPLFEYVCRRCDHKFELLVMSSSETPACPKCQGQDLQKLLSAFAVTSETHAAPAKGPGACAGCGDRGSCAMRD